MNVDYYSLLREQIREVLDYSQAKSDDTLQETIEHHVFAFSASTYLTALEKKTMIERLFHSFRGLDILQPLIDDPDISEIMINSHEEIFVEREGQMIRLATRFENVQKLEDMIQTIVSKVNRLVNESTPIVDARLQDGSRVHVVLPPIALKGPTMTIRKFPRNPMTMDDLVARGALSGEAAFFLQQLVVAKYNILVSGGTGSGKTTFLNALAGFIPKDERIITIEDSAELQLLGVENLVQLETRNANTEGIGEISIRHLIRASLRMRPNRIIVGEVRGAEALDMLQAMNTGHDGSFTTGHANSSQDMMSRLETMVLSGADLPVEVVRQQMASAIDIIIHLSRLNDHTRKVMEIYEVTGVQQGEMQLNPLFRFEKEDDHGSSTNKGGLRYLGNEMTKRFKLMMSGLSLKGGYG